MKYLKLLVVLSAMVGVESAYAQLKEIPVTDPPPQTWKEHWFEHKEVVDLVYKDHSIALYYDKDMDRSVTWPKRILKQAWDYTMRHYGPFGRSPYLYIIMHQGKYGGGHPSTYFDASHDHRNVIDIGTQSWQDSSNWNLDATIHEIGHIVEGASNGVHGSPAFPIWRDSKWMEIYQYDVYRKLGWKSEEDRWFKSMMTKTDNFPQPGTQWFKSWFYPIYNQYGETEVLVRFFKIMSENFPKVKTGNNLYQYEKSLNYGQFVFFWSAAANKDLRTLAIAAFGLKDDKGRDWQEQFDQAKKDFPNVKFKD